MKTLSKIVLLFVVVLALCHDSLAFRISSTPNDGSMMVLTPANYFSIVLTISGFVAAAATASAISARNYRAAGILVGGGFIGEMAALVAYILLDEQLKWDAEFLTDILPPAVTLNLFNAVSIYFVLSRLYLGYKQRKTYHIVMNNIDNL